MMNGVDSAKQKIGGANGLRQIAAARLQILGLPLLGTLRLRCP